MDLTKISNKIPPEVIEWAENNAGNRSFSFVEWVTTHYGELVGRYFAARRYKNGVKITEVMRETTGKGRGCVKNLLFTPVGGYIPVFEREDKVFRCGGYPYIAFPKEQFGVWEEIEYPVGFSYRVLNPGEIFSLEEFKYCGYTYGDPIVWARRYRKDKEIEMFGKLGIPLSPVLMKKARNDKAFKKFLYTNGSATWLYGVNATVYAYEHNVSVEEARRITNQLRLAIKFISELKGVNVDRRRVIDFCDKNNVDYELYNDYLKAIKKLGYSLEDTKNLFPKDFKSIHDLRASEYAAVIAKEDQIRRKELYDRFANQAERWKGMCDSNREYVVRIPDSPADLIREGEALGHCVGKMGYDKKMADGVTVIAFVRRACAANTPYCTMEFDPKTAECKQLYTSHNTRPPEEVVTFAEGWLKTVKEAIKCKTP